PTSSFAAFTQPAAALDATLAVQRELYGRRWVDRHEVRVRLGIHSGYPTLAEENYLGMAVHTSARICSAAHGGQVIVSGDMRTALGTPAATGIRFRRLGLFSLRGIPGEVELFQGMAKGRLFRFPPLRTSQ